MFLDTNELGDVFTFNLSELMPQNYKSEKFASYSVDTYVGKTVTYAPTMWATGFAQHKEQPMHMNRFTHISTPILQVLVHPCIYTFIHLKDFQTEVYKKNSKHSKRK